MPAIATAGQGALRSVVKTLQKYSSASLDVGCSGFKEFKPIAWRLASATVIGHGRRAVSTMSTPLHQASSSNSSKRGPCSITSSRTRGDSWPSTFEHNEQHSINLIKINTKAADGALSRPHSTAFSLCLCANPSPICKEKHSVHFNKTKSTYAKMVLECQEVQVRLYEVKTRT